MPCTRIELPGGGIAIACTRGRQARAAPCFYCHQPHEKLCDHEIAPGKTCDRKLCREHAYSIGPDRDLCPDHLHARPTPAVSASLVLTGSVHHHRRDPDALDVTAMTGGATGRPFAPSLALLKPALAARHALRDLRKAGVVGPELDAAVAAEDRAWAVYRRGFLAEMLVSQGRTAPPGWEKDVAAARGRGVTAHVEAWAEEARRPRRVYLCYCPTRERCHRGLLVEIRVRGGAVDGGELPAPAPEQARQQLGLFGGR